MTQSDNIVEFLKYASPRLDYIEHCMEKQALSASLLTRAAAKARQLAATGGRKSKGNLRRLMGRDTRAVQRPDGSMAFMYKDPNTPHLYRMVGDDASGFGQKFLIDARKGKVRSVQQTFGGYKNPHHSNLNGTVLPSQQSTAIVPYQPAPTSTALAPVRPTPTVNVPPAAAKPSTALAPAAAKSTDEVAKVTDDVAKATDDVANVADDAANAAGSSVGAWMSRHPYLTIGAGLGLGTGGAVMGYNSGSSTGREEAAKALQLYYAMRESMQRQNLQSANSSFLSRLANLFGTGELSNMIG